MKILIAIAVIYLIYKFFQYRNRIERQAHSRRQEPDEYTDYEEID